MFTRSLLYGGCLFLLLTACNKEIGLQDNEGTQNVNELITSGGPSSSLPSCIQFNGQDVFPEGLAYDELRHHFYVSSGALGTVGIVTPDGTYEPFITDPALTSTTGLKVDMPKHRLWVCNVADGVGVYEIPSGNRIFFADLSALAPAEQVFINDVTLDASGNAYITNSAAPYIYKVDKNGNASVFFHNAAFETAPGEFGFNGIQFDERGFLLVAFFDRIVKIPLASPNDYSIVQLDAPVFPDGLLLSKDGKQLVVVNNTGGTPGDQVLTFLSNDQWTSGTLSTTYNTGAVFPTTAASDGKGVFVLYSYLHIFLGGGSHSQFTIQKVPLEKYSPF